MDLMRYSDATKIRPATLEEWRASTDAARSDGGAGVITVDGVDCYAEGENMNANEHRNTHTAAWNGERYATESGWISGDGDTWTTEGGGPVVCAEFVAATIRLVGGPRDGETVS